MRFIAIVALILASPAARAGGCHKAVVVEKQVVQAAVVAPFIQAVTVPLYQYQYTAPPQYQAVQAEAAGDCCQQLVAELAKLRAEVANLRAGGGQIGQAGAAVGSLLATKCASCHTAPNPRGEFAMFAADGKRLPLSLQQKTRVRRALMSGEMPKPAAGAAHVPLTQAEKDAILKELETP